MDQKMVLGEDVARFGTAEILEKVSKKNVSPSLVSALTDGCQVQWAFDSFIGKPVDYQAANTLGSIFHKIVEDFYALEPEDRTRENLKRITKETVASEEFREVKNYRDSLEWIVEAVKGYARLEPNPEDIDVATLNIGGEERKGLEVFVKGEIDGVTCLGFVDRVQNSGDDAGVIVEDWKSGKVHKWEGEGDTGWKEQRQQIMYSMLLEQYGINVSHARLLYPVFGEIVDVDLHNPELRERVVSDVNKANEILEEIKESNELKYRTDKFFLCGWCPLVKVCPKPKITMRGKVKAAYDSQPSPEEIHELLTQD